MNKINELYLLCLTVKRKNAQMEEKSLKSLVPCITGRKSLLEKCLHLLAPKHPSHQDKMLTSSYRAD